MCEDDIEFVYLEAPRVLLPVDMSSEHFGDISDTSIGRYWWRYQHTVSDVEAVIETLSKVRNFLEVNGPFHGVVGFSQGAALAAMITGWLERPEMQPHFRGVDHPPFEFTVLLSGFIIPSPLFELPSCIYTPALVVIGYHDTIVKPEWTMELANRFNSVRVEVHPGGHFVPRSKTWRRFWIDYFLSISATDPHSVIPTPALTDASWGSSAPPSPLSSPDCVKLTLAFEEYDPDALRGDPFSECKPSACFRIPPPTPVWSQFAFQQELPVADSVDIPARCGDYTSTLINLWREC
ncbi:hypothetical protein PUNSTDRAFT_134144 [Punctularia strigosozonata HHB-11173 SS5]|uniref:uncharacterized protein n=1 Tax=Punctularia strigosozonata (strain HHB-11173) TaxID=741275 RepID=UPI0004417221|nr:uncharacterized protein PUNSTDRAFT_134144 [Punctularia strigosozonata HHB-11173 SS5]EIN08971.1 hypothetical protein PUNSTDRAFT_134144 [Punctularia strigosozonata HHB-11173 SS5]